MPCGMFYGSRIGAACRRRGGGAGGGVLSWQLEPERKMNKPSNDNKFLAGHKQVGKKLIPPLMQLENIVPISFQDETLPDLIWIAALFREYGDREAIENLSAFLRGCSEVVNDENLPQLAFLSNFARLSAEQHSAIREMAEKKGLRSWLQVGLQHQTTLLSSYPLAFIFRDDCAEFEQDSAIDLLRADVSSLLDRYSTFATKVQVTAVYLMMITGKFFISKDIELPDFDAVIKAPESEAAKRAASFVRATLNGGIGAHGLAEEKSPWAKDFWQQAFKLEGCS
jgi:hypothetical protein